MGPRSGERGRLGVIGNTLDLRHASMGPRSGERGRPIFGLVCHLPTQAGASMGPRSGERGRMFQMLSTTAIVYGLQWGRALVSAEGVLLNTSTKLLVVLQWGRALVSAEGSDAVGGLL